MTNEQKDLLMCRLDCLRNSMIRQGTAADIHRVGNIRQNIQSLIDNVRDDAIQYDRAEVLLKRVEKKVVDYFKEKFSSP